MTQGTSPHGEGLSRFWADTGPSVWGWVWGADWPRLTSRPAPLRPLTLSALAGLAAGLALTTAWQAAADIGGDLALPLAAGAALAALGLGARAASRSAPDHGRDAAASEPPSRLLAQMQHELRTPLNAVIGFSEAMQHELHGPLGSTRYQEYAAHISESGGRLLKVSEDALAVAATMSTLLADRRGLNRDRLPVAGLLKEAWTAARAADRGGPGRGARLDTEGCAAEVACDRPTTSQALQLVLGEAIAHLGPGGTVIAGCRRDGDTRSIELAVAPALPEPTLGERETGATAEAGTSLRLILARSLLDLQGATLSVCADPRRDGWKACIAFPMAPARRPPRRRTARHTSAGRHPTTAGARVASRVPRLLQSWC
jgi:signal transduction histidine kinase